jgi:hypothetical protein
MITPAVVILNVGEKYLIFYPVPAVIITAGELALDFDKIPITGTAFPTPGTFKGHHSLQRGMGGRGNKSIRRKDDGLLLLQALNQKCKNDEPAGHRAVLHQPGPGQSRVHYRKKTVMQDSFYLMNVQTGITHGL